MEGVPDLAVMREHLKQLYRSHVPQMGWCDDNVRRRQQVEAAYADVRGAWELEAGAHSSVIAAAVDASSTDNEQQTIDTTLANDRSFWSSTGSSSQVAREALLYELAGPACRVVAVKLAVYRALYQQGYPVYPPMRIQVWVGASPEGLQPASPWHDVQATDALQCFALWPHAPIGRFLQVRMYGKLQKQQEDMSFYVAVRHVAAFGAAVPAPALLALRPLLASGAARLAAPLAAPPASCCLALEGAATWGTGPRQGPAAADGDEEGDGGSSEQGTLGRGGACAMEEAPGTGHQQQQQQQQQQHEQQQQQHADGEGQLVARSTFEVQHWQQQQQQQRLPGLAQPLWLLDLSHHAGPGSAQQQLAHAHTHQQQQAAHGSEGGDEEFEEELDDAARAAAVAVAAAARPGPQLIAQREHQERMLLQLLRNVDPWEQGRMLERLLEDEPLDPGPIGQQQQQQEAAMMPPRPQGLGGAVLRGAAPRRAPHAGAVAPQLQLQLQLQLQQQHGSRRGRAARRRAAPRIKLLLPPQQRVYGGGGGGQWAEVAPRGGGDAGGWRVRARVDLGQSVVPYQAAAAAAVAALQAGRAPASLGAQQLAALMVEDGARLHAGRLFSHVACAASCGHDDEQDGAAAAWWCEGL